MRRSRRNTRYLILILLLFCIVLGYAFTSTTLKIDGQSSVLKQTWDVYWDTPVVKSGSVSNTPPTRSGEGDQSNVKLTWTVDLTVPGEYYEFEVDAVNNGTIDAMITGITPTVSPALPTNPDYIKYSVTYEDGTTPAVNDLLKKKSRKGATRQKYIVRVYYDPTDITGSIVNAIPTGGTAYTLKLEITYGQAARIYDLYQLGDLVKYNPVSNSVCTSGSTCYNWRVITSDDSKAYKDITLQMDHNITETMVWTSKADYNDDANYGTNGNNNKGPITALKRLETETSSWHNDLKVNFKYDTSQAVSNYGLLSCTNGACKIGDNPITTNLKARLITGEELADITVAVGAGVNTIAYNWNITSSNVDEWYFFSRSNYQIGTIDLMPTGETSSTELGWLVHNTTASSYSGATNNSYGPNNGGYWTLTPVSNDSSYAWSVGGSQYEPYNGNVGAFYVANPDSYGLRPVITIPKSVLTN